MDFFEIVFIEKIAGRNWIWTKNRTGLWAGPCK